MEERILKKSGRNRVWIISELYYPEETSTGHFMTKIAEGLSLEFAVKVLCAQPTYSKLGVRAPKREIHNGADIVRCYSTTFDKNKLPLRIINLLTISLSIFLNALRYLRYGDFVLVVTNPPLLPYITMLACRLRGAKCLVRVDDVYPDIMCAAGMLNKYGTTYRVIDWFTKKLYQKAERVIALGRDMHELVSSKMSYRPERVRVITNWADCDLIMPTPKDTNTLLKELGISDKFVVQWSGNMGYPHEVKSIYEAILQLAEYADIHFLFIGSGYKRKWLETKAAEAKLANVTFLENRPRNDQNNFLNACDIALSSLVSGMTGISVPSRVYNIMAAGKPILAIGDTGSEIAMMIREEQIGWLVPPGAPGRFTAAVLEARADPARLTEMGSRARRAAKIKYSYERVIAAYCDLFRGLKRLDG